MRLRIAKERFNTCMVADSKPQQGTSSIVGLDHKPTPYRQMQQFLESLSLTFTEHLENLINILTLINILLRILR